MSQSDRVWKFSRSHDQKYVDCPRAAWLEFYYGGKGIVPKKLDLYQATGSLTHAILQTVMTHAKIKGVVPDPESMNGYCASAIKDYREAVLKSGFNEFSGEIELEMQRQAALAEGLARAWTLMRLPQILEDYEIIAVEEEHEIPFGPGQVLMSRLDGVLRRKMDGELLAGPEFKTTGWISDQYVESFRYSTQTLSHCLDVKEKYGVEPAGVVMEFLYKGVKKKGEDGSYTYYSPLVRAYKMDDEFGGSAYGFDSSLGRKKDWKAFDTFTMGMDKWLTYIPEEVLQRILFNAVIYRSPLEVEEWRRQVSARQGRIQAGVIMINEDHPTVEAATEIMDSVFPARLDMYCYSNQYKKSCPYLDVCFHRVDDPVGSGQFVERKPHHANEFEVEDE
jgi:hypothetical protein